MLSSTAHKKKLVLALAALLPLLTLTGGWMLWRTHSAPSGTQTADMSPKTSPDTSKPVATELVGNGHSLDAATDKHHETTVAAGTPAAQGGPANSSTPAEPALAELKDGCFTLTFHHKPLATHGSDDECSHHRNLIKLGRTDVHASSVCIRVNGTPVRHEAISGKDGEFVIGAVAGPKDVVTARFCVGKAKCSESCPYPKQEAAKKDEFLEAISGGSNDDTSVAQWEAGDAEKNVQVNQALDGDLKQAVEEQEVAANKTAAGNSRLEIFKDWISSDLALTCNSGHATARASRSTASVTQ